MTQLPVNAGPVGLLPQEVMNFRQQWPAPQGRRIGGSGSGEGV